MTFQLGTPTLESFKAAPMTTSEIDVHPDSDRIWATLRELQAQHEEDKEFSIQEAIKEEAHDAYEVAVNRVKDEYLEDLERCQILVSSYEDENPDGSISIRPLFELDGDLPEDLKKWFNEQLDGLVEMMEDRWEF